MFFLEGLSKLLMLIMITYVSIIIYDHNNFSYHEEKSNAEYFVLIMLIASLLHEAGELQEAEFELTEYYGVRTACVPLQRLSDCLCLCLWLCVCRASGTIWTR